MRIVRIVSAVLVVLGLIVLLAAPIGPLPGVFIGGAETSPPSVWEDTSGIDEIRLKAPGAIPRVVIIWVIDFEGELYVLGMKNSGWTRMIGEGGPVDVRIGDRTYAVRATPIEQRAEEIYAAYIAKYEPNYPEIVASMPSMEEGRDLAVIFRLDRADRADRATETK